MLRDLSSQIVNIHHVPVRTHSSVKQTVASPVKGPETTTTKNTSQDAVWDLFPNYSQQRQNNKKKKRRHAYSILQCHFESNSALKWSGIGRPRDLKFRYQTMTNFFQNSRSKETQGGFEKKVQIYYDSTAYDKKD